MKYLALYITATFFSIGYPLLYAENDHSLYQQIGQLVLDGEQFFSEKQNNIKEPRNLEILNTQKQFSKATSTLTKTEKKANRIMVKLNSFERKKIAFSLFHQLGILQDNHHVMKPYVAQELNIAIGLDYSKQHSLYKTIDRTYTTFGSTVLATNLSNPFCEINEILKRQKAVKYLVHNRKVLDKLSTILKNNISNHENGLFNYFTPSGDLSKELFEMVYWPKDSWFKSFNSMVNWRLIWGKLDEIGSLVHPISDTCISLISFYSSIVMASTYAKFLNNEINSLQELYNELQKGFKLISKQQKTNVKLATYSMGATSLMLKLYHYQRSLQNFKLLRSIYKGLYERTADVSRVYKGLNRLYIIVNQIPALKEACRTFPNLEHFVYNRFDNEKKVTHTMKKLKNLLIHRVFDKDFTLFSNTGVIQVAHLYISELKDYFIQALEAIGEIDALVSIAKLFKEQDHQNHCYCFTDVLNIETPYIQLTDAWSPLTGKSSKSVSLEFGGPSLPNKIMITGPHGGGKSTLQRTIAHATVLNQSYGIVPAKQARLSVTHKIGSFMNVKEDISKGQSKFMAEKSRITEIVEDIRKARTHNQKIIIFMDEVYSGTMEDQGALMLFNIGKSLAETPHCMMMIATHFKKHVHTLENLYPKFFKNYHFSIQEINNKFVRSFDLKEGRCEWWFKDPAKRNRYIEQLATNEHID